MKVYGQLEKAQAENTTSDTASMPKGMITYRTDLNLMKVSNGTAYKALIDEDSAQTLSTKTLASPAITGATTYDEIATPSNPSANHYKFYFKSTGSPYYLNSAGVETQISTGGGGFTYQSKTTTYTAAINEFVNADATSAGFTVTLPAAAGNSGKVVAVRKEDSTINLVTVSSTDNIEGSSTKLLATRGECITVISNGTTWKIVDRRIPNNSVQESPITISATTTSPTKGTTTIDSIWWWRERGYLVAQYDFRQTTAGTGGTGTYLFTLPGGLTADTSRIVAPTGATVTPTIGSGLAATSNGDYGLTATLFNTTKFQLNFQSAATAVTAMSSSFNAFGNPDIRFSITIRVPIVNWQD